MEVLFFEIFLLVMMLRDVFYVNMEVILLKEFVGWIIVEFVMVYLLGILIFILGEIIMEENISYIFKNLDVGFFV